MTDIVERLRVHRNPMLDSEREEAADEKAKADIAWEGKIASRHNHNGN